MPRPRKKNKNLEVSFEPNKHQGKSTTDDLVGNFLVGIFTAFVTALISQAISNQINWLVVILGAVIASVVLAIYQSKR